MKTDLPYLPLFLLNASNLIEQISNLLIFKFQISKSTLKKCFALFSKNCHFRDICEFFIFHVKFWDFLWFGLERLCLVGDTLNVFFSGFIWWYSDGNHNCISHLSEKNVKVWNYGTESGDKLWRTIFLKNSMYIFVFIVWHMLFSNGRHYVIGCTMFISLQVGRTWWMDVPLKGLNEKLMWLTQHSGSFIFVNSHFYSFIVLRVSKSIRMITTHIFYCTHQTERMRTKQFLHA